MPNAKIMSERPLRLGHGRAFPSACDHIWRMVKMRFGTDELGIDELGTDGLVNLRLVKPSCAS